MQDAVHANFLLGTCLNCSDKRSGNQPLRYYCGSALSSTEHAWVLFLALLLSFICSVASDSLQPHELQHARVLCPPLSPRVSSNSCPLSWSCCPTAALFSFCLQPFPASESFPMTTLSIRWPKYWSFSFSISHSNKYSGLISFKIDWLDLLAVQGTLKNLL